MIMEVLRKVWTSSVVQKVTNSLQKHGILSLNQHGYLPKCGTDTANFQLFWKQRGMIKILYMDAPKT